MTNPIFPTKIERWQCIKGTYKRKIIQYVNYMLKAHPKYSYWEKILLYTSWRDDGKDLLNGHSAYEEASLHVKHILQDKIKRK